MLAFVVGAQLMPDVSRPEVRGALAARRPSGASRPVVDQAMMKLEDARSAVARYQCGTETLRQ